MPTHATYLYIRIFTCTYVRVYIYILVWWPKRGKGGALINYQRATSARGPIGTKNSSSVDSIIFFWWLLSFFLSSRSIIFEFSRLPRASQEEFLFSVLARKINLFPLLLVEFPRGREKLLSIELINWIESKVNR